MKLKLNSKSIIGLSVFAASFSFADFVSIVNTKYIGGVTVEKETAEVGRIVLWGSNTPPNGWLILNGQSTSGYPELASAVGTHVPDYSGLFARSVGGNSAGLGVIQSDSYQSHNHTASFAGNALPPHTLSVQGGSEANEGDFSGQANQDGTSSRYTNGTSAGTPSGSVSVSSYGGVETRPENVALHYIIKAE